MEWVDGELLENQDVKLDFTRWRNCTFKNCNIIVKYGEFDLVGCHFDKCRLSLGENASVIAQVVMMFSQKPVEHRPNTVE